MRTEKQKDNRTKMSWERYCNERSKINNNNSKLNKSTQYKKMVMNAELDENWKSGCTRWASLTFLLKTELILM